MAQRFGGKFSPDGKATGPDADRPRVQAGQPHPFDGLRPSGAGFRSNLLFVLPFLFVWKAFTGSPGVLVQSLGVFAILILSAWLTREGIRAQDAYAARTVARRPAIPRKIFGAVLMGAGLGLATAFSGQSIVIAGLFAAIGGALHLAAFGPDPLSDKGAEGIDSFQANRVAGAVDEAERHLRAMADAILRAGDRRLEARVAQFAAAARSMFRAVESDPRDLTAARKHLGIYLSSARDATVKFADLYARSRDATAREDYEKLLSDLEGNFAAVTRKLAANDRSDLNVEIEVLRERLAREG